MRQRHDRFVKKVLYRTLEFEGAFTTEMEVSPDAQRFDGYFVPSRAHAARRRDLLDRLTSEACAFEAFRAAPSPVEIEGCVRKILNARHVFARAKPAKPLPSLWILCGGDPCYGLAYTGAAPKRGFTRGVYQAPAMLHTGLVVINQLPEVPSTLILRLMGAGRTFQRALVELERLPEDARERHVALPALLVACRSEFDRLAIWSREDGNAQRSGAGWVTSRDRLHGRVVDRRRVVEMALPSILDSAVNGRATDPDPRRKQACARSSRTPQPIKTSATRY